MPDCFKWLDMKTGKGLKLMKRRKLQRKDVLKKNTMSNEIPMEEVKKNATQHFLKDIGSNVLSV